MGDQSLYVKQVERLAKMLAERDAEIAALKAELEATKEVLTLQGGTVSSQAIELYALREKVKELQRQVTYWHELGAK